MSEQKCKGIGFKFGRLVIKLQIAPTIFFPCDIASSFIWYENLRAIFSLIFEATAGAIIKLLGLWD